jgi:hypothetical protein
MNKFRLSLLPIILLFTFCHYESQHHAIARITAERALDKIRDGIRPDVIKIKKHIYNATSIALQNKFACLFQDGFGIAEVSPDMKISGKPVVRYFPNNLISAFYADDSATILCGKVGYRSLLTVDAINKDTADIFMGSYGYFDFSYINAKKRLVLAYTVADPDSNYRVVDIKRKQTIKKIVFHGQLFPFTDNMFLAGERVGPDTNYRTVSFLTELTDSGMQNRINNKLTQAMTENRLFIQAWYNTKCINSKKRILISHKDLHVKDSADSYISIRWDSVFQYLLVEPMLIQCPRSNDGDFSEMWTFSPDGEWLMNKFHEIHKDTKSAFLNDWIEFDKIVFYHVSPEYPNGISPPVFGGISSKENYGCFVNHSTLGPLYIDLYHSGNYVLVYKLNQVLEVLEKRKNNPAQP